MATAPEQKINVNTSRIAAAMVAEVESDLPLLMHANKSVQKPFETAGDGTVMDVIVPEMPVVGDGAWINEGDPVADRDGNPGTKGHELDYNNKAVPVVLKQKHVAFGLPSAMEFNSIADMENLVTKPYGSTLASAVQTEVAEAAMGGSALTLALAGGSKFPQVSTAIAELRKARAYGKLYGVIGSTLNGVLAGEGIQYFNPNGQISDIWKSARLGEYNGAEWFTTPDVRDLIIPSNAPAAASTLTVTGGPTMNVIGKGVKLLGDGAETWLNVGSSYVDSDGAVLDTAPVVGQVLNITGVYVADIFGEKLNRLYDFKILDRRVSSGNLEIKIKNPGFGDAYFAGPSATLSSLSVVTGPGTYYRGVIYAQNALCVAFGRFAKPVGAEVGQYSGQNGVTIRTTTQYQVMKDRNVYRFDTLVGANLARPNHAVELLVSA